MAFKPLASYSDTEALRLQRISNTDRMTATFDGSGNITFNLTAASAEFTFSDPVNMSSTLSVTGASTLTGDVGFGGAPIAGYDATVYGSFRVELPNGGTGRFFSIVDDGAGTTRFHNNYSAGGDFGWVWRSGAADKMSLTSGGTLSVTGASTLTGHVGIGGASSSSASLLTKAATTALSSLRVPHGTAPTSPVDGDMWTTTAGLFVRVNGSTVGPLS